MNIMVNDMYKVSKKGKCQLRDIVYKNFVELEPQMRDAKFQDHRTFGSGEKEFYRFLPYMGMAGILIR